MNHQEQRETLLDIEKRLEEIKFLSSKLHEACSDADLLKWRYLLLEQKAEEGESIVA